jgi:gamma-glutamylcyclotransferase
MNEKVFAYGSNMCSGRFRDYGVHLQGDACAALLGEYRLRFNKLSQKDCSGKANVEPHPGGQVWGVLYTVSTADLAILDDGEGRGYRRTRLCVRTVDGGVIDAWVYVATQPRDDPTLRPYEWYRRFLVEGAREHSLPPEYIVELERIDATEDTNHERDREKRALVCNVAL